MYQPSFINKDLEGDGRKLVFPRPTQTMHDTQPAQLKLSQARTVVAMFQKVGAAHHSAAGTTLWVTIEWCQLNDIPFTLERHYLGRRPSAWIIRRTGL